ncbi:MAG: BON domain-containing protein [Acidobacteria bacterium]|nr:BON domain-containing protein [Acidobacteriota bacterium]
MKFSNLMTTTTLALTGALMVAAPGFATTPAEMAASDAALAKRVRHEVVMLPFITAFDNFSLYVENGKVTLLGHTIRPTLRSSAENVVKRLEGVTSVDNRIEVLPLSRFDDDVRLRVARAIFGSNMLFRNGLGANPSIRIIVKNGDVTLEGVVLNEGERNFANLVANGVFGVFSVKNNLRVDRS